MNLPVAIIGILVALVGVLATMFPSVARIINLPGNSKLKAFFSVIVGLILLSIAII